MGSSPPQTPDHGGARFQQSLCAGVAFIGFFAFDIDRSGHAPSLIKNGDDDLGPGAAERGRVSRISTDIAHVDGFAVGDRRPSGRSRCGKLDIRAR